MHWTSEVTVDASRRAVAVDGLVLVKAASLDRSSELPSESFVAGRRGRWFEVSCGSGLRPCGAEHEIIRHGREDPYEAVAHPFDARRGWAFSTALGVAASRNGPPRPPR